MDYFAYKLIHLLGVFLVLAALGSLAGRAGSGEGSTAGRKLAGALHGVGLLVLFVAGFGLLAQLGASWPWPLWLWLKLLVWLLLGGAGVLIRRSERAATISLIAIPVLGAVAALLAIYKP